MPVMVAVTLALLVILYMRHSITKAMGGAMVGLYAIYTIWLFA